MPRPETEVAPADLLLSIGSVVGHLALSRVPASLLAMVRERYDAFVLPPSPKVERAFSIAIVFHPEPSPVEAAAIVVAGPPVAVSDRRIEIRRWDFEAILETRATEPEVFRGAATCSASPGSLDTLLRVLWSIFTLRAGGALFHACGLRHGELGILAPGPSGAGKTTLARKIVNPDDVLSDEVVAVHRDRDQRWRVSGSPFWGELRRSGISMRSFPLAALVFLQRAATLRVESLRPPEALQRALGCVLSFESSAETARMSLATMTALCQEVRPVVGASALDTTGGEFLAALAPFLDGNAPEDTAVDNPRELISELRAHLKRHRIYAFRPTGSSMQPSLHSGDSLFLERVRLEDTLPGDVLVYWRPGAVPEQDALVCHRMIARVSAGRRARVYAKGDALCEIEQFEEGQDAEVLAKVRAASRDTRTWPMPGRAGSLAILAGSLARMPLLKLVRFLR